MRLVSTIFLLAISTWSFGQSDVDQRIQNAEQELKDLDAAKAAKLAEIESLKLERVRRDLLTFGLPQIEEGEEVIHHSALSLVYNEKHEQAKWVAHIITPDVKDGNVSRTNDFRQDSLVTTKTAVKKDYWNSGFDRGHLAPSADFRWSHRALSESYYYSNMSPQRPELNRQSWAKLENAVRDYVITNNEQVYVVTGAILSEDLPTIGENGVSIPELYFKVVMDYTGTEKRGIAYLMPNAKCIYPIYNYAVSIDSVEALTGINFFPSLSAEEELALEGNVDVEAWRAGSTAGEATPMDPTTLKKGQINTIQAKYNVGSESTVCGTVVSAKYASSGNTYLNLDKKYPNHIFTATVYKDARTNFSYKPEEFLLNKKVCISGDIKSSQGVPSMTVSDESAVLIVE